MALGTFPRQAVGGVLLALLSAAASAQVVMVEGARYESSVQLAGERLVLNGVGVRKRFVFDIYAGGLYVTQRAARTEDLVGQPGPKRVALRFLRDVDGELFVTSLHNGLRANHSEVELAKWKAQVDVLTAPGRRRQFRVHAAGRNARHRQRRDPWPVDSGGRLLCCRSAGLAGRDARGCRTEEGNARRRLTGPSRRRRPRRPRPVR
jgi:hypothetical protein